MYTVSVEISKDRYAFDPAKKGRGFDSRSRPVVSNKVFSLKINGIVNITNKNKLIYAC